MRYSNHYSPHESMSDLLLTVLIIFLLMVVVLSLDVSSKIKVISKDNTYSGGRIRPTLLIDPISYEDGSVGFSFYTQSDFFTPAEDMDTFGLTKRNVLGLLCFIDPGALRNESGKIVRLLDVKVYSHLRGGINFNFVNQDGVHGEIDTTLLKDTISLVWGDEKDNTLSRAKVYYQSDIKDGDHSIVIGHYSFRANATDPTDPVLNMLTTSLTDFVYIGEYSRTDRIGYFMKFGGEDAVDYYNNYLESSSNTIEPPLVKYPGIKKQIIIEKMKLNLKPPEWVRSNFLDKIGANLKIIEVQ